jgi:serine/threonine protein kinase
MYSLGVILFEMLVGQPLFDSPEDAQREGTAIGGPASFNGADVPPLLNDIVKRMMHPDPMRRPQDADEVLLVLKEIREKPSNTVDEQVSGEAASVQAGLPAQAESEPALFDVGDVIDQKYQVQRLSWYQCV